MAFTEFLCSECSHQDDLIRKMDDSSVIICPKCKKNTFAKQVSAPNFNYRAQVGMQLILKINPQ